MKTISAAEARRTLAHHGAAGWGELTRRHGRNYRVSGAIISADPEVARAVLNERANTEVRPVTYRVIDRLLPAGAGILWKQGDAWATRLRLLMPTFTPQRIEAVGREVADIARAELRRPRLGTGGDDLMATITAVGLRTALQVGYNLDAEDGRVRAFGEALVAYKHALLTPRARFRGDQLGHGLRSLPGLGLGLLKLRPHARRLDRHVRGLVDAPPLHDPGHEGWLQRLVAGGFSGRELTSELNHLYSAYDAIDFVACSALVALDEHPEWAGRMRPELAEMALLPTLSRTTIDDFPATRAFIFEVLRFYPVSMLVARQTAQPIQTERERIEPGSLVMLSMYSLQRDPEVWDDPDRFDPSRWLDPAQAPPPGAFVPFLTGPRKCIGQGLAELQLLGILMALRDRRVRVDTRGVRIDQFAVPRWDRPLPFRVEDRKPARIRVAV